MKDTNINKTILHELLMRLKASGQRRIYLSDKANSYISELLKYKNKPIHNQTDSIDKTISHSEIDEKPSRSLQLQVALEKIQELATRETQFDYLKKSIQAHYRGQKPLFGEGSIDSELIFLVECPNAKDIQENKLFSDQSGVLFDKILNAMGMAKKDIYLSPIFKSQKSFSDYTSGNQSCLTNALHILRQETQIISPKLIICLGNSIAGYLNPNDSPPLDALENRGHVFKFNGINTRVTFSLSSVIHKNSIETKRHFWKDLLNGMESLGLEITEKQRNYFK